MQCGRTDDISIPYSVMSVDVPDSPKQLESQVRQLRLRAESQAADASEIKAELETAQTERMSLQKQIGLLTHKNEDLVAENGEIITFSSPVYLRAGLVHGNGAFICCLSFHFRPLFLLRKIPQAHRINASLLRYLHHILLSRTRSVFSHHADFRQYLCHPRPHNLNISLSPSSTQPSSERLPAVFNFVSICGPV